MEKTIVLFSLILIFSIVILMFSFFMLQSQITGEVIKDYYSYTKAVCNESNFCQDYEIACRGNEMISQNSITGAIVQHSKNWIDPRDNETIEKLC